MMDKDTAIKKMLQPQEFFVAYAQATNMPYISCDEETMEDEVWVFASEDDEKAFAKKMQELHMYLTGMKVPKNQYQTFFSVLYAMGVDAFVFNEGEASARFRLDDIIRFDMNKLPENKRPLMNQPLQLSGLYFMQELRRPQQYRDQKKINALEEEVIANLRKADILMAVDSAQEGKVNIPCIRNKEQKAFQPFFSDTMEAEKFIKGKKLRLLRVKFMDLSKYLIDAVDGYAINPLGFNLLLTKEQIEKLTKQ